MKEPIFILINDIHIDKNNGKLVEDVFTQVLDLAEERGVSHVIIGGDVFTNRSGQPLDCLATFQKIIDLANKKEIILEVIPGNHDKTDPDDYRSYIDIYRGNRILTIRREGSVGIINGCAVAFVPYFSDEKWKEEFLKAVGLVEDCLSEGDIDKKSPRFLITHVAIEGVKNNDGSEVVSELKPSMFDMFTKVFIGHYHNASKVGKNIYYTGSAYQNNFGENVTDKGCTVVYSDGSFESIPLKFPKYIKHVIDVNDSETLRNLIEQYEGEDYNHVRFVIQGRKVDASKINLSDISAKGIQCQFESIEEREAVDNSVDEEMLSYDKRSMMKDFIKFCADNDIKGKYMKYGMNLVKNI